RNVVNLFAVLGLLIVITACVCRSDRDQQDQRPSKSQPESSSPDQTDQKETSKSSNSDASAPKRKDEGDFIAEHEQVQNPRYYEIDRQIKQEKLLERAADDLNRALILPHDIYIRAKD